MKTGTAPAYILDLSPNGLGAVRTLARRGVEVRAFDSDSSREGFRTRYGRTELCPDPVTEPVGLMAFLFSRAAKEEVPPFLLPTNDKFVRFLAEHSRELEGVLTVALPYQPAPGPAPSLALKGGDL